MPEGMNQRGQSIGAGRMLRHSVREPGVEYWRVRRVARYLDVSPKRVYQMVYEKKLQAIRLGPRQMRIMRVSIDEYVDLLLRMAEDEEMA